MKKNSAVHERLKKYAGCEATQFCKKSRTIYYFKIIENMAVKYSRFSKNEMEKILLVGLSSVAGLCAFKDLPLLRMGDH